MSADPCAITGALAADYQNAVTAINRKFNALQRLAELLEQLGDVSALLEGINPSALIPLYAINFDAYTDLVNACPFLNLPKTPSNASTAQLQQMVSSAYAGMIRKLNLHPFIRLGSLQAQLNKVQTSVNEALNTGEQFVQCLAQACASTVGLFMTTNFQQQLDQFKRGYLASNGQVLTQEMQGKLLSVRGLIDNVNELMSTAPVITPSPTPLVPQVPIPTDHPIPIPPTRPTP